MGERCGRWAVYGSLLGVWRSTLQTVRWTNVYLSGSNSVIPSCKTVLTNEIRLRRGRGNRSEIVTDQLQRHYLLLIATSYTVENTPFNVVHHYHVPGLLRASQSWAVYSFNIDFSRNREYGCHLLTGSKLNTLALTLDQKDYRIRLNNSWNNFSVTRWTFSNYLINLSLSHSWLNSQFFLFVP